MNILRKLGVRQVLIALGALCLGMANTAVAKNHTVGDPGTETIALALQAATDGDVIKIPAGTYTIQESLEVDKAVTIKGAGSDLTVLESHGAGFSGWAVIHIDPGEGTVKIKDLQIVAEEYRDGIVHWSGDFELKNAKVVIRNAPGFVRPILLVAYVPSTTEVWPSVVIRNSSVVAEDTTTDASLCLLPPPAGCPVDTDLIVANWETTYEEIAILNTSLVNGSENAISHGIEFLDSLVRHTVIRGNDITVRGIGIELLHSIGTVDIRDNTITAGHGGIGVKIDSDGQSYIKDNVIQVEDGHLDFFPKFLEDLFGFNLEGYPTAAITLGTDALNVWGGGLARNVLVKENVLLGDPEYGISMLDSHLWTNVSSDIVIKENDFTGLSNATCHIAQDADVHDITIEENVGLILPCP